MSHSDSEGQNLPVTACESREEVGNVWSGDWSLHSSNMKVQLYKAYE